MLLVIHNLPPNTRYADVKALVKAQCGLSELIVDNLVSEGKSKKVTVGLADDSDGALLMRKINGLYVAGQQLFVENAKQNKAQSKLNHNYDQGQYNQYVPPTVPEFNNSMYYKPQNEKQQFFSPVEPIGSSQLPETNFGVPYYMTNQNPSVGNTQEYSKQVQYPQVQGPASSDPYGGQNYGTNRGHESREGVRNRSRSRSPNRGSQREREPRASTSRWNEPERKGSDSWPRASDKTSVRDRDRYYDDQSYNDRSYQDSYPGRSERNYGSNKHSNDRFDKNYKRSDSNWESSYREEDSSFGRHNESYDSNDRKKVDMHSHRYHEDRQPQDFREDQYSRSRNSDDFSRGDNNYGQKRIYDAPDKNKFAPKNKKFGNNQQYNLRNYPDASGSQYLKKTIDSPQHNKTHYNNKVGNRGPVPPMQLKQNKFKPPLKKSAVQNPPNLPKDFSVRWEGWLCQASSIIAQQVLKNVQSGYSNKKHPIVVKLKACVRTRIDVITGNQITMKLNDMLRKYREKFPESDDHLFYETVLQKVDQAEIAEFLAAQEARLAAKDAAILERLQTEAKPAVPVVKQPVPKPKPANLAPIQKPSVQIPPVSKPESQKLPKYPSTYLKKARNEEITNDSLYTLDDLGEKILKEELDKIFDMCNEEIQNAEDDTEKSVGKFMSDVVLTNLRKIMSLLVKKRVLDIRTNLVVRIYCHPKCPRRTSLDAFLRSYGVISLKKSDTNKKLYVATCASYEYYDALCKLNSIHIESMNVQFRPLHTIKPPKGNKNKKQKNNANMNENSEEHFEMDGEGDEGMFDDEIADGEEKDDDVIEIPDNVIEIPDNATGDEENNGYNKDIECTNEKSDDVIEVEDHRNNSADTIVIEDDKGEADVAVDEITTNKDVKSVNDEATIDISDDNQNIEPESVAAIDFAADDLEDF